MSKRFGRNQKRRLMALLATAEKEAATAKRDALRAEDRLTTALREQLSKGHIPLEVEHFLSPERRNIVMRAMFDQRKANLYYSYEVDPMEMRIRRDREERERFATYLGRAIADRMADAYAGQTEGSSRG